MALPPILSYTHRMQKAGFCLKAYGPSIALSILIWGVFGQAIHFQFLLWDDNTQIYQNPHLQELVWRWPDINWIFSFDTSFRFQPIAWLGHMLIGEVFGMNPGAYHFCLIVLHFINSLLVYKLSLRMLSRFAADGTPREMIAFMASAFWAINALRDETLGQSTHLTHVLATLFVLGSFHYYLSSVQGGRLQLRPYLLSFALNGLAVCTYPTAVGYAFCLPFFDRIFLPPEILPRCNWRLPGFARYWFSRMLFMLPSLAVGLATIHARWHPVGVYGRSFAPAPTAGIIRLIHGVYAWACIYLHQFWPFGLTPGHYPWRGPSFHWVYIPAWLCLVGLFAVSLWKRSAPMLAILVASIGLAGPVLGLTEEPMTPADRYTYLPNAFFALFLAWAASQFWSKRPISIGAPIMLGAGLALLAMLGLQSHRHLRIWADSHALFAYLETTPEIKSQPGYQEFIDDKVAWLFVLEGNPGAALPIYDNMVRHEPKTYRYWYERGITLYMLGKQPEAIESLHISYVLHQDPAILKMMQAMQSGRPLIVPN
jgi:protein O-mannosyl-transferase